METSFRHADFAAYDRIYSLATDVTDEIGAFAKSPNDLRNVSPDPWYGGEADFVACYRLIEKGCRAILEDFRNRNA